MHKYGDPTTPLATHRGMGGYLNYTRNVTRLKGVNMPYTEDVTDVKEFMTIMTDVKVSVAEMNGKMDRVMDATSDTKESVEQLKGTVDKVKDTAVAADNRSKVNEKEIKEIKENNRRITIALISIVGAFVLQIIFFMLTFGF